MSSMAAAASGQSAGGGGGGGAVPFLVGSQRYREQPFFNSTVTLGASQQTITPVPQITPGNFLSGVVLQISSSGGVLGTTATLTDDGTLGLLNQVSLTDTGGGEILYPMNLFAIVMCQKYLRPWLGDPTRRSDYSNSINPAITVRYGVEVRDTLAVLANTDARAQYRLNVIVGPTTNLVDVTTGVTPPDVTVKGYLDAWAQPDAVDLAGRPITPLPPGLSTSRFLMHEAGLNFTSGDNTIRLTLTGNEIRGLVLIFRDSTGARIDLTDSGAGPLRFRLDNRSLWVMNPSQIVEEMEAFYSAWYGGGYNTNATGAGFNRETGVYVIPRFRDPGNLGGEFWLQTVEQSLLQIEVQGGDLGTNSPGTVEIIYDQLAVAGALPGELEGI